MTEEPTPIALTEQARRWAVALLRHAADTLEAAPRRVAFDALVHLGVALVQLERRLGKPEERR